MLVHVNKMVFYCHGAISGAASDDIPKLLNSVISHVNYKSIS